MNHHLTVTPRDPLVARDGRPFGAGQGTRMRSLSWPYPSVLAGSLRTLVGKRDGGHFDETLVEELKQLAVAGPLPLMNDTLYFPPPLDIIVRERGGARDSYSLRPLRLPIGDGCNLPAGLQPVLPPERLSSDFKPAATPPFWSCALMSHWLVDATGDAFAFPQPQKNACENSSTGASVWGPDLLGALPQDERVHVQMEEDSGAGREGGLFVTVGLDFWQKRTGNPLQMAARLELPERLSRWVETLDHLHPFGGERRLAHWKASSTEDASQLWRCPQPIRSALPGCSKVRMLLTTPALFAGGWKPGWLDGGSQKLEGVPPGSSVRLRLVGAAIQRWKPLSGWSLEAGRTGPKAVRRLTPAGSVYFFEVCEGMPESLSELWLRPVSDLEQDRRDGFGLALWGPWKEHPSNSGGKINAR